MDMSGPSRRNHLLVWPFLCAALSGCAIPEFGDDEAGLALEDLASGLATSRLAEQNPRPSRESIRFMTGGEERAADLYLPPKGARAGIVLVPGMAARGKRDSRIVAIANTLARFRHRFCSLALNARIWDDPWRWMRRFAGMPPGNFVMIATGSAHESFSADFSALSS